MKYIHVKNLEKYHPGYKDRNLIWCKAYFSMLNADAEFEMLKEIDKWRFLAFVMLELQMKKPLPLNPDYFGRKGFDLKKRSIDLTLKMLHNFITYVTEDSKVCVVEVDKEVEEDKNKVQISCNDFISYFNQKTGKNFKLTPERARIITTCLNKGRTVDFMEKEYYRNDGTGAYKLA